MDAAIKKISETRFRVKSFTGPGGYIVTFDNGLSLCTCPHFVFRCLPNNTKCKHIQAVEKAYPEVLNIKPKLELVKSMMLSEII